uniref:Ig-like domain-containing protein n=1 Tax=Malurus cyaneus samueli TaxID=2593467 RepID=A0A8C5TNR2_9PASS
MIFQLSLGLLLHSPSLIQLPPDPPNLRVPPVLHSLRYQEWRCQSRPGGPPVHDHWGTWMGSPFTDYDSERGRWSLTTPWMKKDPSRDFGIGRLKKLKGLHTLHWVSGCDLLSDGSVRGFTRMATMGGISSPSIRDPRASWRPTALPRSPRGAGMLTRTILDYWMDYVEHTCREWLQKSSDMEPPDVHVSGKEEYGILTLSCHAYGFYPSTIAVSWMKGDEIRDQETQWGGIVPNSDGTFHTWARIEARPEEREQYRCRVEHPGMPEPGIFAWGEAGNVQCGNWGISKWEFSSLSSLSSTFPRAKIQCESHPGGHSVHHRCHCCHWCHCHRIWPLEAPIR